MADVLWDQGRLLVRRSQTLGDEVMNTTKQGKRYSITVPQELIAVLEWHVRTQLTTPEQEDSDLLFPSGAFLARLREAGGLTRAEIRHGASWPIRNG